MTLMKALKTFRVSSTGVVVSPGVEFETTSASDYERRGMAVPIVNGQSKPAGKPIANKAAEAGPLASPGGAIGGMTSQSLSHQDRAPKKPHSK